VTLKRGLSVTRAAFTAIEGSTDSGWAALPLRTPAGKRVAYAEVLSSGKARLFAAPTCVPD
jgi:hypothetical protein